MKIERVSFSLVGFLSVGLILAPLIALGGNVWDGGGTDDNWGTGANWNPDGAPTPGSGNDLYFAGTVRLTPYNNYTPWDDWRNIFFNSGAGSFTITGNPIDLFGKIENNSSVLQQFNLSDIAFLGTGAREFNPVNGDLRIGGGGNIYNNGRFLDVWGNKTLYIAKNLQGTGGLAIKAGATVVFETSSTYSGDTFVENGTLSFAQGGSASSTYIRLGHTSGSATASLFIVDPDGGTTVSNGIEVRSGSTGVKTIGGTNTSGNNAFTGSITLNDFVRVSAAAGGSVTFSGVISGSGMGVTKIGDGVVILSGANTYTGQTSVDAGTLRLGASDRISDSSPLFVGSGATFDLNNFNEEVGNIVATSVGNITLGSGQFRVNQNSDVSFGGVISGTGSFVKKGTAVLTLTGANSYSGETYIDNGELRYGANQALSNTGTINVGMTSGSFGAAVGIGAPGVNISNPINIRSGSTGVKSIVAQNTTGSATFSGNVTLHDPVTVSANAGGNLNLSGNINTSGTGNQNITVTGANNTTISGVVSGGGHIIKQGGGVLTLAAANTFTGNLYIDQGTAQITGDINSPGVDIGSSLFLSSTATLTLAGSGASLNNVTFKPSNISGDRILAVTGGNHTISGTLTVDRDDAKINVSGGSLVINNLDLDTGGAGDNQLGGGGDQDVIITVGSGASTTVSGIDAKTSLSFIDKHGGGTLYLSGNNSGKTFSINNFAGTLSVNSGNVFGSGHAHNLSFMSNSALHVSANSTVSSAHRFRIDNAVNATIDVDSGVTFTMNGIITNLTGSGNLIKRGSGTLVLTATNGYSGTTLVDVGTLVVNGSIASSSLTTVDAGGFLKGSGQVGALTIDNGGAFSPGNSPGTLYAGNTTWNNGGSYIWEINDVDAGAGTDPGWDLLDITGTLNVVSNFTIYVTSLTLGNAPGNVHDFNSASSYTWKVAQTTGGVLNFSPGDILLNLSGFSNPYSGSWSVTVDANNVYVNYFGALSIVPEPSAVFLLVVGAGLCYRRWRTRR